MASNCQGLERYSRQDLQHLLDTPELLESVYQTTHPQAQRNLQAVTESWSTNRAAAGTALFSIVSTDTVGQILARQEEVRQARKAAGEKLAEAKELEKQWQTIQAEMEQALKVYASTSLKSS